MIISSPEPSQGGLIVYPSSRWLSVCLWVCVSVHTFKHEYLRRGPIVSKFYLKHNWVGGKAVLRIGPDRIISLVSIATDSSHRVIMEKMLLTL